MRLIRLSCVLLIALALTPAWAQDHHSHHGHDHHGHHHPVYETPGEQPSELHLMLTGRMQARVNDQIDTSALIYQTTGLPRLLLVSDQLSEALLLVAGEKNVHAIAPELIQVVAHDQHDQFSGPSPEAEPVAEELIVSVVDLGEPNATLRIGRGDVQFDWQGAVVTVQQRDPMLGQIEVERMLTELPEYRRNAREYEPLKGHVRLLQSIDQPTEITVFFGSWCPHCERLVPRLIRVMSQLEDVPIRFQFHGVPIQVDQDPLARQYEIRKLPALIVRREGRLVSHVDDELMTRPEEALTSVLFSEPEP